MKPTLAPASPDITFALLSPSEPGNVGAAARSLAAFGFSKLCVLAPVRPLERIDAALAVRGGRAVLESVTEIPEARIDAFLAQFDELWGTTARRGRQRALVSAEAAVAGQLERGGRLLILFGPERDGLDRDWLDRCQKLLRLPTSGGPLNLAHAVTVVAYEFSRQLAHGSTREDVLASQAQRREILGRVQAVLGQLAYPTRSLRRHPPEAFLEPIRSGRLSRLQARWLLGLLTRLERALGIPRRGPRS
jgi:tRNA/rRNA methyltransferase